MGCCYQKNAQESDELNINDGLDFVSKSFDTLHLSRCVGNWQINRESEFLFEFLFQFLPTEQELK